MSDPTQPDQPDQPDQPEQPDPNQPQQPDQPDQPSQQEDHSSKSWAERQGQESGEREPGARRVPMDPHAQTATS